MINLFCFNKNHTISKQTYNNTSGVKKVYFYTHTKKKKKKCKCIVVCLLYILGMFRIVYFLTLFNVFKKKVEQSRKCRTPFIENEIKF